MKTRNIGMNRGRPRIWLQNGELTDNGIKHGDRFDIEIGTNWLRIRIDPEGARKIAGKPGREIIDIAGKVVEAAFDSNHQQFYIVKKPDGIVLEGTLADPANR